MKISHSRSGVPHTVLKHPREKKANKTQGRRINARNTKIERGRQSELKNGTAGFWLGLQSYSYAA